MISGDSGKPELGISSEDRETLTREVDFIFHGAATVKFDEKLRTAFNINIRGTKCVLDLARETTNLKVTDTYRKASKKLVFDMLFIYFTFLGDYTHFDCIFELLPQGNQRNVLQTSNNLWKFENIDRGTGRRHFRSLDAEVGIDLIGFRDEKQFTGFTYFCFPGYLGISQTRTHTRNR